MTPQSYIVRAHAGWSRSCVPTCEGKEGKEYVTDMGVKSAMDGGKVRQPMVESGDIRASGSEWRRSAAKNDL